MSGDVFSGLMESGTVEEIYFLILSVVLAFGMIQTAGTALGTDKPVVSVISTSMCPALQVGDVLVVNGVEYSEIQEDDVIVYSVPDRVEFEVDGTEYSLEAFDQDERPSVSTAAGNLTLVDVKPNPGDRSRDAAVLKINGEIPGGEQPRAFREDTSYSINGAEVSFGYMTDQPRSGVPIVHRVQRKTSEYVETLGDNNPRQIEFENSIQPDQIRGKVVFEIPRVGVIKVLAMDLAGLNGGVPLALDTTPSCG